MNLPGRIKPLFLYAIWMLYASVATGGPMPIFELDTHNKSAVEIGRTLGTKIKQRFPDIEQQYDAYLATLVDQAQFDQWIEEQVRQLAPKIDQAYRDEASGIMSAWTVLSHNQLGDGYLSTDEYWLLLLIPDITNHAKGSGFGVWGNDSQSGAPIVGHNLDWSSNTALRPLQVITIYRDQHRGIVNIGFAGIISTLSGFNSAGLYLAHLDASAMHSTTSRQPPSAAIGFDLRKMLEQQDHISGVIRQLSKARYGLNQSVLMADAKDVRVLEQPANQRGTVRTDNTPYRLNMYWNRKNQIAAVNCYASAVIPDNCSDTRDILRWNQFRTLATFNPEAPAEPRDLISIMFDTMHSPQAIFNQDTLQAMVFEPQTGQLHLYTASASNDQETETVPRMTQYHGLLTKLAPIEYTWLNPITLTIPFILAVLFFTIRYGESTRNKPPHT